jgi:hypothetical protein
MVWNCIFILEMGKAEKCPNEISVAAKHGVM